MSSSTRTSIASQVAGPVPAAVALIVAFILGVRGTSLLYPPDYSATGWLWALAATVLAAFAFASSAAARGRTSSGSPACSLRPHATDGHRLRADAGRAGAGHCHSCQPDAVRQPSDHALAVDRRVVAVDSWRSHCRRARASRLAEPGRGSQDRPSPAVAGTGRRRAVDATGDLPAHLPAEPDAAGHFRGRDQRRAGRPAHHGRPARQPLWHRLVRNANPLRLLSGCSVQVPGHDLHRPQSGLADPRDPDRRSHVSVGAAAVRHSDRLCWPPLSWPSAAGTSP